MSNNDDDHQRLTAQHESHTVHDYEHKKTMLKKRGHIICIAVTLALVGLAIFAWVRSRQNQPMDTILMVPCVNHKAVCDKGVESFVYACGQDEPVNRAAHSTPCLFLDSCNPSRFTRMRVCQNGVCAQHENALNVSEITDRYELPLGAPADYPSFQCECDAGYVVSETVGAGALCVQPGAKCHEGPAANHVSCTCEAGFVGRMGACASVGSVRTSMASQLTNCNATTAVGLSPAATSSSGVYIDVEASWIQHGIVGAGVCSVCTDAHSMYSVNNELVNDFALIIGVCKLKASRGPCDTKTSVYVYNIDLQALECVVWRRGAGA